MKSAVGISRTQRGAVNGNYVLLTIQTVGDTQLRTFLSSLCFIVSLIIIFAISETLELGSKNNFLSAASVVEVTAGILYLSLGIASCCEINSSTVLGQ